MSLLPLLMSLDSYDPWELQRHNRVRPEWDSFGLGMTPQEIHILANLPSVRNARQRNDQHHHNRLSEIQPQVGKDGFQVLMDVQQFRPNEISVKTVDNVIIVEGKHEERHDEHGSISRQFLRKYQLPKDYDSKDVLSTLSSDGVLTIKAPPPQKSVAGNERVIQIQQTGPAHLNVKQNSAGGGDENAKAPAPAAKKNGN